MDAAPVLAYFRGLQRRIVDALAAFDGQPFLADSWDRPEGGGGLTRLVEEGGFFERGGVNFSHITGSRLPPSATAARPSLAGRAWEAMGVSLVLHPRNPYCPTAHMNVRCFILYVHPRQQVQQPAGGDRQHLRDRAGGVGEGARGADAERQVGDRFLDLGHDNSPCGDRMGRTTQMPEPPSNRSSRTRAWVMRLPAGTPRVSHTLPPMLEPRPIVMRPSTVAPA